MLELRTSRPHPALAGVALRYTGFSQQTDAPVCSRELPGTYVPLILDLGEGWTVGDPRRPPQAAEHIGSFVAGLTDHAVLVEHPGHARCLQVDLTPVGARRLLGFPMHELANRVVPLADVLGRTSALLLERLAGAPSWDARFALLDRALAARLADAAPGRPEVAWALGRMVESAGGAPIGGLAGELGWSHRRLIARFRDEVGLAPKLTARIVRFERLQALLAGDPTLEWARAAAACGYSDQAHLAREVRELTGLTPTGLRGEGVNFVQDAAAAPA